MLVVGGIVNARRQQHDARVGYGPGRQFRQRLPEQRAVVLDASHPVLPEQLVEAGPHGAPIRQHVGDAGGHAQVVLQHHEAVHGAHQVGPAQGDVDAPRHRDAAHLDPVLGTTQNHVHGDDAVGEDPSAPVDVGQEQVQRLDPLVQAALDEVPGGGGDDPRQHVDGDDPFLGALLPVDGKGDPLLQERAFRALLHGGDVLGRHTAERFPEFATVIPRRRFSLEHFVVEAGVDPVIGEQGLFRRRAADSGRVWHLFPVAYRRPNRGCPPTPPVMPDRRHCISQGTEFCQKRLPSLTDPVKRCDPVNHRRACGYIVAGLKRYGTNRYSADQ